MNEKTWGRSVIFTIVFLAVAGVLYPNLVGAQTPNLITNPSFESAGTGGLPASWVKTSWGNVTPTFIYPVAGKNGTDKAASINLSKDSNGDARWSHTAVSVEAGATYTFSNWYKSDAVTEINVVYTKTNGSLTYDWIADLPSSANVWKQTNFSITIPSGIKKVVIFQLISKKGTLVVDEFSLTKNGGVTPPPPPASPTLTFSATPTSILAGEQSTLAWTTQNVTSCTASSGWSGTKAISGNQTVSPSANTTYSLSCVGSGGTITKQVTVSVTLPPPPPPPSSGSFSEGMVTLSFDDGWLSQYEKALPILEASGLKATFYVNTEPVKGLWDGYMLSAHIKQLHQQGHEIASHTETHPHLPTLGTTALNRELKNSKTYLEGLIGAPITALAYPYGELNTKVKNKTKSVGYTTGRGTEDGLNLTSADRYNLKSPCPVLGTPLSEIKSMIDEAKAKKQWYIVCLHEVDTNGNEYSMTPASFGEIVNYIKTSGIKVVTVKEGAEFLTSPL